MNNYRFPKWYYSYESGATKSQREMKHYLRAYVLQLESPGALDPSTAPPSASVATVLARHASPSFTLISYRRATEAKRVKTEAAPAAAIASIATADGASSTESEYEGASSRRTVRVKQEGGAADSCRAIKRQRPDGACELPRGGGGGGGSRRVQEPDSAEGILLLGLRYGAHAGWHHATPTSSPLAAPAESSDERDRYSRSLLAHELYWRQAQFASTLVRARELAMLHYFLAHAALDDLWGPIVRLDARVQSAWVAPLTARSRRSSDARTQRLLAQFRLPAIGPHGRRHRHEESDADEALSLFAPLPALGLCADVAVELVASRAVQDAVQLAVAAAASDLDAANASSNISNTNTLAPPHKLALRTRFARLVDEIHALLNAALARKRSGVSDLADDLVTLAHQSPRLRWMQQPMRELLQARAVPDECALEAFCAQAREALIWRQQQSSPSSSVSSSLSSSLGSSAYMSVASAPPIGPGAAGASSSSGSGRKRPGRWSRRWLLTADSLLVRSVQVDGHDLSDHRVPPSQVHRDVPSTAAAAGTPRGSEQTTLGPARSLTSGATASAWEVLSTLQMFGAVDLQVDTSAAVRIHSVFGPSPSTSPSPHPTQSLMPQSPPMHLRLDGKYRIFRTFPTGLSTLAVARHGWTYGDYFGYIESPVSIKLWLFAYRRDAVVRRQQRRPDGRVVITGLSSDRSGDNSRRYPSSGSASLARCIAVHLTLLSARASRTSQPSPSPSPSTLSAAGDALATNSILTAMEAADPASRSGGADDTRDDAFDRVLASVKIDEAPYPASVSSADSTSGRSAGASDCALACLASGERHALWKSLHWHPSAEFEVQYEQLDV